MKKMIIMLLAILPIFLLFIISFAGRVLNKFVPIPVERVSLANIENVEFSNNQILIINKGDTLQLKSIVYPLEATNKEVIYKSGNTDVCTVDSNGLITAIGNVLSSTTVTVQTVENSKIDMVEVRVVDKLVSSIEIVDEKDEPISELELSVGESRILKALIKPLTAENKKYTWSSTDPDIVSIDPYSGKITAKKQGEVTIVVTTDDGGHTASCKIMVNDKQAKLYLDFSKNEKIHKKSDSIFVTEISEIRLIDYIFYDSAQCSEDQIKINVKSGPATYDEKNKILYITSEDAVLLEILLDDGSSFVIYITLFYEG